jgi:putative sterol carrier protein
MSAGAQEFYGKRIPEQFNRALEVALEQGGPEDRLYSGLIAVSETLAVLVEGEGGGSFFLNVREGRMSSDAEPDGPPFLTLVHDGQALEVLERESGDSALAFLGGMAGLADEIHLTKQRIQTLKMISGAIRFSLIGDGSFSILTHFGTEPLPDEPHCSLNVDREIYDKLQAGEVDVQEAFMSGKVEILGDMQMAMQLALAVLTPD